MGKLSVWMVLALVAVGCSQGQAGTVVPQPPPSGNTDGGSPSVDPGGPAADAGTPDAGPVDAGSPGGITFGTPGPWPIANVIYGAADGIQESPVVGVTTDEPFKDKAGVLSQNLWIATNSALYVKRSGDSKFLRFDGSTGALDGQVTGIDHRLHLPGNPASVCFDSNGTHRSCPNGDADTQGITEIVGGGPNEVFVGYYGHHDWSRSDDGTWTDPWMHSGKLDRVRLQPDGTIEVVRMDMVSNNSPEFWHNKSVWRMIYDHFKNPHELYVGTDHGVDKISPDLWHAPKGWFLSADNQQQWMSDHLHPQACFHHLCDGEIYTQMLGDFRGLALDAAGDLWVGGRWAAGKIRYTRLNSEWWQTPRPDHLNAINPAFGDGNCPFFCPPQEGDPVNISAVAVTPDGKVWATSGTLYNDPADVPYGVASYDGHQFVHYDPFRDLGMVEQHIRDILALPDGRLVIAGPSSGLVFFDPKTGSHVSMRGGQGIPDDRVLRLELDTMVVPPALHVATAGGAAVLRKLP